MTHNSELPLLKIFKIMENDYSGAPINNSPDVGEVGVYIGGNQLNI